MMNEETLPLKTSFDENLKSKSNKKINVDMLKKKNNISDEITLILII